uniref:Fibronectin type-III domain-containing protein n=1 Tax=Lates calcarifer TaxID=8187 RepID=A0A4W6EQ74_LATCA
MSSFRLVGNNSKHTFRCSSYCTLSVCLFSSSPPIPVSVVFSSVNLRNVLQWYPGDGTPWDTLFTVQYAIYGDSVEGSKGKRVHWRAVHQCTNIVQKWCDLTNETWDHENGYYGRVRACERFDPTTDTIFGPPLVYVEIDGDDAVITLEGPMRYQPNNNTPLVSMATLYPQMTYTLSIHNGHHNQTVSRNIYLTPSWHGQGVKSSTLEVLLYQSYTNLLLVCASSSKTSHRRTPTVLFQTLHAPIIRRTAQIPHRNTPHRDLKHP